jgi:drug/metabolite transporter (DMT)-like permease
MKQHVLGDRLFAFQWIGVIWNVVSVVLVGGTAILNESEKSVEEGETKGQALLGVLLVMAGAVIQSMQFVFEEKVMTMVGYENELENV